MITSGISITQIENTTSDVEVFDLLSEELRRLSRQHSWSTYQEYYIFIKSLPTGLRSMAAVYDLDVSMTLDDLGWHFMNWHSLELVRETLSGLQELGAVREAEIFNQAIEIAGRHWTFIGSETFKERYMDSPLNIELAPLNHTLWELMSPDNPDGRDLLSYWAPYARKFPHQVVHVQ
jgi:hypothetical protein